MEKKEGITGAVIIICIMSEEDIKKKSRMWVREDLKTIIRSQCSIGILENQKDQTEKATVRQEITL